MAQIEARHDVCFVCDGMGHWSPTCSQYKEMGCPRCGAADHWILKCPHRPRPSPKDQKPEVPVAATEVSGVEGGGGGELELAEDEATEALKTLTGEEAEKVALEAMTVRVVLTEKSRRFFVALAAAGQGIVALLDDAAELTMIDAKEVEERQLNTVKLVHPVRLGVAIQGEGTLITRAVPNLYLQKGEWKERRRALVVPRAAAPLILGVDWFDD